MSVGNLAGVGRGAEPVVGSPLPAERLRLRAVVDAMVAKTYGVDESDLQRILTDCDATPESIAARSSGRGLDPKGFWRVEREKDPELRHTVLTAVALRDLEEKTRACGGDRDAGIEAFLGQNEGQGWMLPETLRLADYGLGHDERANYPQAVASRLGPRFYDWQLAQSPDESWRECHLHARGLFGEQGCRELLAEGEHVVKAARSVESRRVPELAPGRLF